MNIFQVVLIVFSVLTELNAKVRDPIYILQDSPTLRTVAVTLFNLVQPAQNMEEKKDKMQTPYPDSMPFFCDISGPGARSETRPNSINKLRPGDIDIVAAMGDSITAGHGILGTNLLELLIINRGLSSTGGGQATWRQFLTLPNILKEYNPNLYGYALGNSFSSDRKAKFNVAEGAALSHDMLYQARLFRMRLINDPKVNMTHDWKMVSIFIGALDFCNLMCHISDPNIGIVEHENDYVKALRYLRDNIPRLMVNLLSAPDLRIIFNLYSTNKFCNFSHNFQCNCFGSIFGNKTTEWNKYVDNITAEWKRVDEDIAMRDEFHTEEFTVTVQPFTKNLQFPYKNGEVDLQYLSSDCVHFSQKFHKLCAIGLWNNLLEPLNNKSDTVSINTKVKCPTPDRPYIATKMNSQTSV